MRVSHKFSTKAYLLVLLIISIAFLFHFYPWFFTHPNEIISCVDGDGLKSYFVSMSYIKNQNFSNDFHGMNYPYGLTMIYTDGNPALTFFVKIVSWVIPSANQNFVGFYNVSILISYLLSVILFFRILKSFSLPDFFSAAGAFSITMLSPQMFRVLGHPSFTYVVFFPLSWYLLIKFFSSEKKLLISFFIIANSCFWFFVQPYYLMSITLFYFFSWGIELLKKSTRRQFLSKFIFCLVHVIIPVIITKLYLTMLDHHSLRPQYPGGFFDFYARFETVFAPYYSPLTDIFKAIFRFNTENQYWEAWSYIGLSGVFVFFFSLFRIVRYLIVKKNIRHILSPVLPDKLGSYLWAAVLILLFSMCIPFKWHLEFLLDYFPWIRQFRALGRFAWVFYYVFLVYSVFVLYAVYRKLAGNKLKALAYAIVIIFFTCNFAEASWYQTAVSEGFRKHHNPFLSSNTDDDFKNAVQLAINNKDKYQCILPLPYYHSGGEEFEVGVLDEVQKSMVFSYQTGIPLMSSAAARTSIEEGRTLINFFAPPFIEKKIKDKLNKKKFLVFYSGEVIDPFQQEILRKSTSLNKGKEFELLELSYDSVFNPSFNKEEWLRKQEISFISESDSLSLHEKGFTGKISEDLITKNFDTLYLKESFAGEGSFKGIIGDYSMLVEPGYYPLYPGKEYVASYWYRYTKEKSNENTLVLELKDSTDKIISWLFGQSAKESYLGFNGWIFVQRKFRLPEGKTKLDLFFKGNNRDRNSFLADELMIRPADKNILSIKKVNGTRWLFYNNMPVDTLR